MFWLGRAAQQEQKQDAEEMSSSTRAPQQERTREAAEASRSKQESRMSAKT